MPYPRSRCWLCPHRLARRPPTVAANMQIAGTEMLTYGVPTLGLMSAKSDMDSNREQVYAP